MPHQLLQNFITTSCIYYTCLHPKCHSRFIFIETLCYDDGCHLKKYATNPSRSAMTPVATQLASLQIVVDRMHFKGHTDPWCHEHCDPNKVKDLHKVRNTLN